MPQTHSMPQWGTVPGDATKAFLFACGWLAILVLGRVGGQTMGRVLASLTLRRVLPPTAGFPVPCVPHALELAISLWFFAVCPSTWLFLPVAYAALKD